MPNTSGDPHATRGMTSKQSGDQTATLRAMLVHQHELIEDADLAKRSLLAEINERTQAEARLHESEERARLLFDLIPAAVFRCDKDAVIQAYNRRAVELWGREPVLGVEKHCGSFMLRMPDGTPLPHEQSPLVDVLRTGNPANNVEVMIERPDGSRLLVLANFAATHDADGAVDGSIVSFIDITERKRAEHALREAEALNSAQKQAFELAASGTPLITVLETLARAMEGHSDAGARVAIHLLDESGARFAGTAAPSLPAAYSEATDGMEVSSEIGPCCVALIRNQSVTIANIEAECAHWPAFASFALPLDIRAAWSVPILSSNGHRLGTVATYYREPRDPLPADTQRGEIVSGTVRILLERKLADDKLRASERFSRTVLENSPDCVKLLDRDGHLQFMNANGLCLMEIDDFAQVQDRCWWDLWVEESRTVVQEAVAKARHGETVQFQAMCPTAKGRAKWWDVIVNPVTDDSGTLTKLLSVSRDITDSKRAEQALRESETRKEYSLKLSDALRPLSDPGEVQAIAGRLLGEYLDANRVAYFEMRGDLYFVSREYVKGARPLAGGYPVTSFGTTLLATYRRGAIVTASDVAGDPDLTPAERAAYAALQIGAHIGVPLIKGGEFVAGLAVHMSEPRVWTPEEIALAEETAERTWAAVERARAEAALRDAEDRFRTIADNISQLAWTCDSLGNVTWYNQRWLDYTGLTFDDMQGWQWSKVQHPDHLDRVVARVKQSAETGQPWDDTFPLRGKDGEYRWFLSRAVPVRDEHGHVVRWFGTNTDVTELREAQQALRETDRRKDEFLAMLAHELRNPLAPIRTGLELIRLAGNSAASVERVRATMDRQVGHMVRLIDDLFDVSRITSGKIQLQRRPLLLADVVNSAIDANRPALDGARIELRMQLPDQPCLLDADPTRLVQVVSNLLHNAVKFTAPGGHIDVSSRETNGELELTVADDGIGISPDMLPRVFELFTQGEQRPGGKTAPGLGIGLALSRRLIEMHGGTIEATSKGLDQGSTFKIRLPITRGLEIPDSPATDVPMETATRRVVIIDDNEDAALTMAMLVEELGNEARVAHDGADGLQAITEFRPDIVLLDIGMPGMDGHETCRRIRSAPLGSDLFIVALTGWGQEQDKRRADEAGFDAHLTKPADPATLERILAAPRPSKSQ